MSTDQEESWGDDEKRRELEEQMLGHRLLSAPIGVLSPRPAIMVTESATIREAIDLMLANNIGAVMVEREGLPVGIFTERDVLRRVAAKGVDTSQPITRVMTPNPETLHLEDGIAFALNRMIAHGYRHVPITDDSGAVTAVLSVREVVAYIVSLLPDRIHNLPPEPHLGIPRTPEGG